MFVYHMDPLQPYFVLNTGVYHKFIPVESHVCTMFTINNDAVCRIYPNYWATKEDFDWALDALDKACAYVLSTMG